jgi:hypothetical protein
MAHALAAFGLVLLLHKHHQVPLVTRQLELDRLMLLLCCCQGTADAVGGLLQLLDLADYLMHLKPALVAMGPVVPHQSMTISSPRSAAPMYLQAMGLCTSPR